MISEKKPGDLSIQNILNVQREKKSKNNYPWVTSFTGSFFFLSVEHRFTNEMSRQGQN